MGDTDNFMPLLCALGWHRPKPVARWNHGYYFTRCARCGVDLVRTAYGRWHVPHGHRVVWQAEAPAGAVAAALVREGGASAPSPGTELPIQEVLRQLQNGDLTAEAGGRDPAGDGGEPAAASGDSESDPGAGPARPEAGVPTPRAIPAAPIADFMDETTEAGAWEAPARTYLLRPGPADRAGGADASAESDPGPGPFSNLRARLAGLFERRTGAEPPTDADHRIDDGAPPAPVSRAVMVALVAAAAIVALLLVLVLREARDSRPAGTNDSEAQGEQLFPGPRQPAFVTASVLNCRSGPALEAEPVKVLMRGDAVELLARDGEWVSLVHEERQCWALARYLSVEEPI